MKKVLRVLACSMLGLWTVGCSENGVESTVGSSVKQGQDLSSRSNYRNTILKWDFGYKIGEFSLYAMGETFHADRGSTEGWTVNGDAAKDIQFGGINIYKVKDIGYGRSSTIKKALLFQNKR